MKIEITAPRGEEYMYEKWSAEYRVIGEGNARIVQIDSLSGITVLVSRVLVDWYAVFDMPPSYSYYISSPNFNVATDGYESLNDTAYLAHDLSARGMPKADAQTVAQVLRHASNLFGA